MTSDAPRFPGGVECEADMSMNPDAASDHGSAAQDSEHPAAQCWQAVAAVLTGQRLSAPPDVDWRAEGLVGWLSTSGWDAARLTARRHACQQERRAWPDPLPDELALGLEFARYSALLAEVRRLTGLDGLSARIHHGPIVIGPEEERLIREVPPHSVQR